MSSVGPTRGDETVHRAIGWALVLVQFMLLGALIWPLAAWWQVPAPVRAAGHAARVIGLAIGAIGVLGLGGSLTPSPVPRRDATLVTTGAYRWVRHPIYSGLLVFALGSVAASAHPIRMAAAAGLTGLLTGKARWEERMLADRVAGYGDYARSVGRFVPRWR